MDEIKNNLSKNLTNLRKQKNLTQLELANQMNYSDKSVSKWENGDAVPDIEVLQKLAQFYGITIDMLIGEMDEIPEIKSSKKMRTKPRKRLTEQERKMIIALLFTSIIWVAATVIFSQIKIWLDINAWISFVWAIPASCLLLFILNITWIKQKFSTIIASVFVWTLLAAMYLQFLDYNIWVIFFIGAPFQLAIFLFRELKHK